MHVFVDYVLCMLFCFELNCESHLVNSPEISRGAHGERKLAGHLVIQTNSSCKRKC